MSRNDEVAWRQRSRVQWLKQGDKNIKYFHRVSIAHGRYNTIEKLEVERVLINEEEKFWLQRQFEEEEVLEALKLCASDKAPSPDGFPMSFYQS